MKEKIKNHIEKGEYQKIIEFYHELIKKFPDNIELLSNLGFFYDEIEEFEKAIEIYDKALKICPQNEYLLNNKGNSLLNLDKQDDAIYYFKKATEINPFYPMAWNNLGTCSEKVGDYLNANSFYDRAISLRPDFLLPWYNKAISFTKLKNYKEALKCINTSIKLSPESYEAWTDKGLIEYHLEEYNSSEISYSKALELNPKYLRVLINIGSLYHSIGKYEKSIEFDNKALEIEPNFEIIHSNKGISLAFNGNFQEALKSINKAIEINQDFPGAYLNLGITYIEMRKYEDAINILKTAQKLFEQRNDKVYLKVAQEFMKSAKNAQNLLNSLKSIDILFLECLNSDNLKSLSEEITQISNMLKPIINVFKTKELPEEVIELTISKKICIECLEEMLNFKKIDIENLYYAKVVFTRWDLIDYKIVVNSIENFYYIIKNYESFKQITIGVERALLGILKNLHFLDGELSIEILKKLKTFKTSDSLPIAGNLGITDSLTLDKEYYLQVCHEIQKKIPKYRTKSYEISDYIEFISQFPKSLRRHIAFLLKKILFISFNQMRDGLIRLIDRIIDRYENTYFIILNRTLQKSPQAWKYFIDKFSQKKIKEVRSKNLVNLLNKLDGNTRYNFLFIDDVIGSGNQFKKIFKLELGKYLRRIMDIVNLKKNIRFYLIAGIGTSFSITNISHEIEMFSDQNIFYDIKLRREDVAFNEKNWKDKNALSELINFLKERDKKFWNGYNDCQYLVVLEWNTPNNTIGCIWHQTDKWNALFPRANSN